MLMAAALSTGLAETAGSRSVLLAVGWGGVESRLIRGRVCMSTLDY